jgi:phosphoglycolate phosphatase
LSRIGAVLWDIDGTLLTSGKVAGTAFLDAVEQVTGTRPEGRGLDLGGRIDPEIAGVLLESVGADDHLVPPVLAKLREIAVERVADFHEHVVLLPGVRVLVDLLERSGVTQTVVTGNIDVVGRIKLAAAGLVPPIAPELGGFGDGGRDRVAVARVALGRLAAAGGQVSPERSWIVGDTPRDLHCARALGLPCALVGTGRHSAESMAPLGADVLLDSFEDPSALLRMWKL